MLGQKTLKHIHTHLRDTELPSWVSPVPTNIGTKARGKLSADQWHVFCVINLPVILIPLWYRKSETHRDRLDNYMDLVTEVMIGSLLEMSEPVIQLYEEVSLRYLQTARRLYNIAITPNQHNSLHIPSFLRLFGALHAIRTFFSERMNFLLQGENTNMKIGAYVITEMWAEHRLIIGNAGELESTYMKHSCRAANFRATLEDDRIRSQVEELAEAFEETVAEDRRGTRIRESTLLDPPHKSNGKALKQITLPDDCFDALIDHLNHKAGQELFIDVRKMRRITGMQQLSNQALKCPRIFHGGVSFLSSSESPRDSNLLFRSSAMSLPCPGRVLQIFKYAIWNAQGALTNSTYLYVAPLEPLSAEDAVQDPYRSYKHGGGELYYDQYLAGIIITAEDVVSHYARTPMVMPSIQRPCVHVLSLDKVRCVVIYCVFTRHC